MIVHTASQIFHAAFLGLSLKELSILLFFLDGVAPSPIMFLAAFLPREEARAAFGYSLTAGEDGGSTLTLY